MSRAQLPVLLEIDLECSRRDRPSQLAASIHGRPVLVRTIERILRATEVGSVVLVVREEQAAAARTVVGDLPVEWFTHRHDDIAQRARWRRARRWGKEGWRGGIGGSLFVSEAGNPRALEAATRAQGAAAALVVPADAPLVDATLLDELARAYRPSEEYWLLLSTAAPGLAGDVFHVEAFAWLSERGAAVHELLPLRPDDEATQYEQRRLFHTFSEDVTQLYGRFTADSTAAVAQLAGLIAAGGGGAGDGGDGDGGPSARQLAGLLRAHPAQLAGPVPEELVVELGRDQGGSRAPRSGPAHRGPEQAGADANGDTLSAAVWDRLLESMTLRDDALLTLGGGYHDPLLDAQLGQRIAAARSAGAFGVHVATTAACIDGREVAERLLASSVDVISVELGAPDAESLAATAPDTPEFARRVAGLETLLAAREGHSSAPYVVAGLTLREETASRWEAFYERWFGRVDGIVVRSPERARGEWHPAALGCFTPPSRFPCLRLGRQLRVEYDGRVPLCDRDPDLAVAVGRLPEASVAQLWQGAQLTAARAAHGAGQWHTFHHCGPCVAWCRLDGS